MAMLTTGDLQAVWWYDEVRLPEDRLIAWRDASSHNLSGILKFA